VAEEIDTAVKPAKTASPYPCVDRVVAESQIAKLGSGDDSMLAAGEHGDGSLALDSLADNTTLVGRLAPVVRFAAHMEANPTLASGAPTTVGLAAGGRSETAGSTADRR
jgi:hypothetical protein